MNEEVEYDVVIDALQERIDALMKLIDGNMRMGMINIMDQIRFEHIDKLEKAITLWKEKND